MLDGQYLLLGILHDSYAISFLYFCAVILKVDYKEMVQIDDVIVSLDVFREKFVCNLDACKGECCIEGDAGAPVELEEVEKLEEVLPVIWDDLSPEARAVIDKQGVVYTDSEGDLVTSIVNGKDCVFTCYDEKGIVTAQSRRLIGKGVVISTSRYRVICILYV